MKRLHVLFVCIGNICRSAMAEAMARKYGSDVLSVGSAGTAAVMNSHVTTRAVLSEINVDLGDHMPRRLSEVDVNRYDLLINMSGSPIPFTVDIPVETWEVEDPFGRSEEAFRKTRADIEMRVMDLVLRARLGKLKPINKSAAAIDSGSLGSRQ